MKQGSTKGCSCGMSLHIATKKVKEHDQSLSSDNFILAIKDELVVGCIGKCGKINKAKLRNVAHISVKSLTGPVKALLGNFQYLIYLIFDDYLCPVNMLFKSSCGTPLPSTHTHTHTHTHTEYHLCSSPFP